MLEAGQRPSQGQHVKEAHAEHNAGTAVCAWDDAVACRHLGEGAGFEEGIKHFSGLVDGMMHLPAGTYSGSKVARGVVEVL